MQLKTKNQLKDGKTKNIFLLKDWFKELNESYASIIGTFVKNELEQLAAKIFTTKNCLKTFLLMVSTF